MNCVHFIILRIFVVSATEVYLTMIALRLNSERFLLTTQTPGENIPLQTLNNFLFALLTGNILFY